MMNLRLLFSAAYLASFTLSAFATDVPLAEQGQARAAIYVSPRVMAPDAALADTASQAEREAEMQRRRLRESVNDLAVYLQRVSDAEFTIHTGPPEAAGKKEVPILIAEYARERFGGVQKKDAFRQGWRMTVADDGIGLQGESDEAASYAIYEVLDRLGCRWFMPGEIGESIPHLSTVQLPAGDVASAPTTAFRGILYADDAFNRRNRLGGLRIQSLHALETYITKEQREQHPEWRAIVDGKPHATRLKWSNPEVADAIADAIIAKLDKHYIPSVSLSPGDGMSFDESEDRALDAGDWDAPMNQVSITDRYIVLCNRIAERVARKYPDVLFGFLAYVQYTRPPVREKLHPNLIPEIAPINFCRAHSFCDPTCPSRQKIREIVEGWSKVSKRISYYNYMFHLAEVTAPYPMIRQMSEEIPVLYRNNVIFWQPETLPNFEEVLPGMWLSLRLAWNKDLDPKAVLADFYTRFYGAAAVPMQRYWEMFDEAWTQAPLHAGGLWSYNRRFTPQFLHAARAKMEEALKAAATPMEYRRVALQERALRQFERLMQMRLDLAEGRLAGLDIKDAEWYGTQIGLAHEYAPVCAFSGAGWTQTVSAGYYRSFAGETHRQAGEMARTHLLLSPSLRHWKYAFLRDPGVKPGESIRPFDGIHPGEAKGWNTPGFDDSAWPKVDVGLETWADLNLLDDRGTMWYRQTVAAPKLTPGKKTVLWLSAIDGTAKVYVNGTAIPFVNKEGETSPAASGYAEPFAFDITNAIKPGEPINIAIAVTRDFINEMGTGGLLSPAFLFQEK